MDRTVQTHFFGERKHLGSSDANNSACGSARGNHHMFPAISGFDKDETSNRGWNRKILWNCSRSLIPFLGIIIGCGMDSMEEWGFIQTANFVLLCTETGTRSKLWHRIVRTPAQVFKLWTLERHMYTHLRIREWLKRLPNWKADSACSAINICKPVYKVEWTSGFTVKYTPYFAHWHVSCLC